MEHLDLEEDLMVVAALAAVVDLTAAAAGAAAVADLAAAVLAALVAALAMDLEVTDLEVKVTAAGDDAFRGHYCHRKFCDLD